MADFFGGYSEEGFVRQRRNLIVGSAVLLLMQIADVRVGPQISLFGLTVNVGKPDAVHWFLFFAVIYWAIRFYQYHRQRRPVEMKMAAQEVMTRYLRKRALDHIVPTRPQFEPPSVPEGATYELTAHDFGVTNYQRSYIEAHLNPAWLITNPDGSKQIKNIGDQKALFKGRHLWTARSLGYFTASVNTPAFTDYVLPYILFAVSIGYAAYRLLR